MVVMTNSLLLRVHCCIEIFKLLVFKITIDAVTIGVGILSLRRRLTFALVINTLLVII